MSAVVQTSVSLEYKVGDEVEWVNVFGRKQCGVIQFITVESGVVALTVYSDEVSFSERVTLVMPRITAVRL